MSSPTCSPSAIRSLGRFREGYVFAECALRLLRENFGDSHEETLLAMHFFASDLRAKGDFHAAREMNKLAYDTAVARFGEEHPETLGAANNYALSLRHAGHFWTARRLDKETLLHKQVALDENHRHTLLTMDNWAIDLRETGEYTKARDEHGNVVLRMREQLDERRPMTLSATKNLATSSRKADHRDGMALQLAIEAVEGLVGRYSESHPEAMSAVLELSVNHQYVGNFDEARSLGEHAWELYKLNWGTRHPFSMIAATNLAITLRLLVVLC